MTDLVVRTRVAVTKRNLERIADLAAMMLRSESGMGEFIDLPTRSREKVLALLTSVRALMAVATPYENSDPVLWKGLGALETALENERDALKDMADKAALLRTGLVATPATRKDVATYLVKAARETNDNLTEQNYWKMRERCQQLFNEYVDLLRGIALRNAGFGDPAPAINVLFTIADKLPGLWPEVEGWAWQSLTVPSRTERRGSTEAMVLRIGFPEWTIWALPLLQHEFGYVYVKKRSLLADGSGDLERARLADALATLITGPAYACAALLLRLIPGPGLAPTLTTSIPTALVIDDAPSEAAVRSATILAALRSEGKDDPALLSLADRLEADWRAAILAAEGSMDAFDGAIGDPATAEAVETARQAVLPSQGGALRPPFWVPEWPRITEWAAHLKQRELAEINLSELADLSGDARPLSVAGLLNAAWFARVAATPAADATEKQVDDAARDVVSLLTGDSTQGRTGPSQLGGGS